MNKGEVLAGKYNLDGLLIVISGPSGVGKGTICKEVLRRNPDLMMSVSVTTRTPRPGETEGEHYFFRTEEQFQEMIEKEQLLEYAHVFGKAYYGTPSNYVHQELSKGHDVLLEIDVAGAQQVRERFPKAILIFIAPPSIYELERRLRGRGTEGEQMVANRMLTSREELQLMKDYDYVVVNSDIDATTDKIKMIITAEKCRIENNVDIILKLTGRA
ncbi:MAG: guanylate kinase [Christensenellales bacterium]